MGAREQEDLLPSQPLVSGVVLAFGTMAILTGMITVQGFITSVTVVYVAPEMLGPTVFNSLHYLPMAPGYVLTIFLAIGRAITAEDVSQLYHDRPAVNSLRTSTACVSVWAVRWV